MKQQSTTFRGAPKHGGTQTKTNLVYKRLRELAYEQGPAARLPTIDEMCLTFATSRATLNDALEQLESQNIIFRKRGSGIYVSQKIHQKNIALVVGTSVFNARNASPFWDALWGYFILNAQDRSRTQKETFSIHVVGDMAGSVLPLDDQLVQLIESKQIDGILSVGLNYETGEWIKRHEIPLIAFAGTGTWHVVLDFPELVRMGTESLIEQGCKRIRLWIVGNKNIAGAGQETDFDSLQINIDERILVFREVLSSHGLEFSDDLIWSNQGQPLSSHLHQDQGYRAVERLRDEGLIPVTDGIMITDDFMTLGALKAMHQNRIGCDIKIASHANKGLPVLYAFEEQATRIEFDPQELVRQMFLLLDSVQKGGKPDGHAVYLKPSAVILPREMAI